MKVKAKKILSKILITVLSMILVFLAPASTYAKLSADKLDMFAQNNIMFYDPDETESSKCKTTSNGVFKGVQYDLTDAELRGIARMVHSENNCNITAIRTEASQMVNLYEKKGNGKSLVEYLTSGWYSTDGVYDGDWDVPDEELQVVKDVLINGNRNLPPQVTEHDGFNNIRWIETNGERHESDADIRNTSLYVPGKTIIHNGNHDPNEYYIFYQWAGGNESKCGDPFGYYERDVPAESYSTVTGSNVNYAGDQVFSDAELQTIEANRPFYEEVASEYNFPWQFLAILHYHESGLKRENPSNGQGAYQLYSYVMVGPKGNKRLDPNKAFLPAGPITDEEFLRQTKIAVETTVVPNMNAYNLDLNNPDDVKKFFFAFNGQADDYKNKALDMGFTEEQAKIGEGSYYVMNRYDERRDPTSANMDQRWKGRFLDDGYYDPDAVGYGFGAFVQYEALAGGSSSYCGGNGNLVSGGLTLEEAKQVMKPYIDKQNETRGFKGDVEMDGITLTYFEACGNALKNCPALSKWFLAKYTSVDKNRMPSGDGCGFVKSMINYGFEDGGHVPRAYAIFSTESCDGHGHTGVVFGVDEERGKIIIGEAGCNGDYEFTDAKEDELSKYTSGKYSYAYTDAFLIGVK